MSQCGFHSLLLLLLFLSVGGSFVGGIPLPGGILMFGACTYSFFVIGCRGMAKWFKRAGVSSMIFKVPSLRGEIGDPLNMYSVNRDNLPT